MGYIDPGADDEMNFIALHNHFKDFISRSFAKLNAVIICFKQFIYFLKSKNAFSYQVNSFKEAFRRQFGIFKNQLINYCFVQLPGNNVGSGTTAQNYLSMVTCNFECKVLILILFIRWTRAYKQFAGLPEIYCCAADIIPRLIVVVFMCHCNDLA